MNSTNTRIIIILGSILVILVAFAGGVAVGYHKGVFSYNWNANYSRGMNDPRSFLAPFQPDNDDINPHGTVGEIISIHLPDIMVKGVGTAEQIVTISPTTTVIRSMHDVASTTVLKTGMQVVVIGSPDDDGRIHATFVRIMPPRPNLPPQATASMSPTPNYLYQPNR